METGTDYQEYQFEGGNAEGGEWNGQNDQGMEMGN